MRIQMGAEAENVKILRDAILPGISIQPVCIVILTENFDQTVLLTVAQHARMQMLRHHLKDAYV